MSKKRKSGLQEKKGVSTSEVTNNLVISKIQKKRKNAIDPQKIFDSLIKGDITALSRAITVVESANTKHHAAARDLILKSLPHANKSIRVGITGVPGVGKSTFIEALGKYITSKGHRVAVLAIDPSSSLSKGSILGDKTRMEELVKDKNAYIRPSASGKTLGGVARKTRESIILCEAAGFDIIIVETVGVGQGETTVHSMVDFFLLLKLVGAGDELQGIKRGIIEMADAIAINKADGNNLKKAEIAKKTFENALHLYPTKASDWQPKVVTCSALKNQGIEDLWNLILNYISQTSKTMYFEHKRNEQNKFWLMQTIENQLTSDFFTNKTVQTELQEQLELINENKTTAFAAAEYLLSLKK